MWYFEETSMSGSKEYMGALKSQDSPRSGILGNKKYLFIYYFFSILTNIHIYWESDNEMKMI